VSVDVHGINGSSSNMQNANVYWPNAERSQPAKLRMGPSVFFSFVFVFLYFFLLSFEAIEAGADCHKVVAFCCGSNHFGKNN